MCESRTVGRMGRVKEGARALHGGCEFEEIEDKGEARERESG